MHAVAKIDLGRHGVYLAKAVRSSAAAVKHPPIRAAGECS
jgi:hypothetical protein